MLDKVVIANRGEIALGIQKAAKALGLRTVCVYSEADAAAPYLETADAAVCIGPSASKCSYLNADAIILAALQTGAGAIHPGYGFLSENAAFAQAVVDAGLVPQLAVYTDGDVDNARRLLIDSGLVKGPLTWLLLAGLPGCTPMYSPQSMMDGLVRQVGLIRQVDPGANIIVCAGGRASLHLANLALLMGLHVRVGMEDTVWKWPHRRPGTAAPRCGRRTHPGPG